MNSILHNNSGYLLNAGGVAHYPSGKSLRPAMAMKKNAYTVSTELQSMAVAEKISKEAAARQFGVDSLRILGGSVKLTNSDNFCVKQIVRQMRMFPTAPYNKKALQKPKYKY